MFNMKLFFYTMVICVLIDSPFCLSSSAQTVDKIVIRGNQKPINSTTVYDAGFRDRSISYRIEEEVNLELPPRYRTVRLKLLSVDGRDMSGSDVFAAFDDVLSGFGYADISTAECVHESVLPGNETCSLRLAIMGNDYAAGPAEDDVFCVLMIDSSMEYTLNCSRS